MDKLVRQIEVPMAKNIIKKAGLYIVEEKDLDKLAERIEEWKKEEGIT